MKRIFSILFFVAGCTFSLYPQDHVALKNFIQSVNLKYASVGVKVVDLGTGETVCAWNEDKSLVPASTLKIITTASALEILGEQYVFNTLVYTDGEVDDQGVLQGNIYIKGGGDPTLGSEYLYSDQHAFLKHWLDEIRKKGITAVGGSVIVQDDLYGYQGVSNKWYWEDLGNYYASGIYGISVFDNTYRLYLKSGAVGTKPSILRTEPDMSELSFENHLVSSTETNGGAYIQGIPFSPVRRVSGRISPKRSSYVIKGDIPDPGLFLASCFTSYLNDNGIVVSGKPSTSRLTEVQSTVGVELVSHKSNSIGEIIKVINFRSNNHYAEHLFYAIGGGNHAGSLLIKDFWNRKGVDTEGLFMYDGSGLSASNAVSVNLLTDILIYMKNESSHSTVFSGSLPEAGREGTVRSFLNGTTLEGHAQIKSGSISGVQSFAGYIRKNEKNYAFSIIVNNFVGSRPALRSQIETFLLKF